MNDYLRLFIAIELSPQQRREVALLQGTNRHKIKGVRWVRPEQLHLTLKFLGDTNIDHINKIKIAMDESAASFRQFQVNYGGCGVFPTVQKARVIWVGLKDGKTEIENLFQLLDLALTNRGFKQENRRFKPHLTIGRITRFLPEHTIEQILSDGQSFESSHHVTAELVLFESRLTESRAIHTPLYKATIALA